MMKTTRERRIEYIQSYSDSALANAMKAMFSYHGFDFFEDHQIEELLIIMIANEKSRQRRNISGRKPS